MKISIVTPTYNSENTLEETIQSVVRNKRSNEYEVEYIIIDGGSKDSTLDIVKRYGDFVDCLVSEKDNGISDAFNKGILRATGDIIGIINSDDQLMPDAILEISKSYEKDVDVYYGDGYILEKDMSKKLKKITNLDGLRWQMTLFHPSVFVTASAYKKYGMFDTNLKCVMDRDLLLRMYVGGAKFKHIEKPLAIYRMGGESQKNYFKYVVPESENISIKYGGSKYKAKLWSLRRKTLMRAVFLKKKLSRKF